MKERRREVGMEGKKERKNLGRKEGRKEGGEKQGGVISEEDCGGGGAQDMPGLF